MGPNTTKGKTSEPVKARAVASRTLCATGRSATAGPIKDRATIDRGEGTEVMYAFGHESLGVACYCYVACYCSCYCYKKLVESRCPD
jgi:hypothetical protein